MISPETCRAARGLLKWSQQQLADSAHVGVSTVKKFEAGISTPITNNLNAMRSALEDAGVEFVCEDNGGPGVLRRRLRIRAYIPGEGLLIEVKYTDLQLEGLDNEFDLPFRISDDALKLQAGRTIIDEVDAQAVVRKTESKWITAIRKKIELEGLSSPGGRPREISAEELL